jgi:heptosyltransferase III
VSARLDIPERARILIITLRRFGDVLLTTPLIRTLRRGFAQARLEALVFQGSERVLAGNPDLDDVLTICERPSLREAFALVRTLWRRYDLVVSTQAGDRPTFFAWVAGRRRVGLVPPAGGRGASWKRHVHDIAIPAEPGSHRVVQLLSLAKALGLEPVPQLVCPQGAATADAAPGQPYAVLHPNPFYPYKR